MSHLALSSLFAASVFTSVSAFAAPVDSVEHIVVTGTRTDKLLTASPVKVDVIDKDEISLLSKGTLRQVLEVMPGVVVRRSQKDGYNVQLNGFNSDHVLVLVNSQPVISTTGSSVDLDQISVANIRQIEIVRGAASVLYGSSAMGGVINIITDTPMGTHLSADYELSHFTDDGIDGDTLGHTAKVNLAKEISHWQIGATAQYINTPGFDYDSATVSQDGGAVDKSIIQMSLATEFNDIDVRYKTQWLDEQKDKPQSAIPGQSSIISYQSDVTQWQHDISFEQHNNWHINGRYLQHDEQSGNTNGLRKTDIQLAEIEAQKIVNVRNIEWVGGLVAHSDTLDQQRIDTGTIEVDDVSRESVESYLQANWHKNEQQVLFGIRVQNDSDFGWHSAAKFSASKQWERDNRTVQFRIGGGSSYRVPNLKERYYVFDHSNLGYMVLGNVDLVPETALSFNVGVGTHIHPQRGSWSFQGDINLHYTDAKEFITTAIDAQASQESGLEISVYENLDEATLYGADFSIGLQNQAWQLQLNYSYLHTENGNSDPLPERPTHLIKASVSYQFKQSDTQIQFYGVHENDVSPATGYSSISHDNFVTLNGLIQHEFSLHWRAQFGIENITNEHRSPNALLAGAYDARPISSRRIYLGVSYQYE